jgi:hypothetical protein
MKKALYLILLITIAAAFLYSMRNLTPSEREHCLITSTDKSICN